MPCVFCGSTEKLTGEHVWPKWIRKQFPPAPSDVRHAIRTDEGVKEWGGPPFTQTVRDVCEPCNTGWMNDLEVAVQPSLKPLFAGRGRALHSEGQRTLAAW